MGDFPPHIPNSLTKAYKRRGVTRLFAWQTECLSNVRLFEPTYQNVIYTAPTSAGKTLVAEVVAGCNVLTSSRRALFVFPYISNAREKLFDLQSLWRSAHLVVKGFIGASSASLHGWSAAVCTIEKANTLINAFIENGMLAEIGVIVIDELHMLFDSERGAIVENMLSKLLFAADCKGISIQIVGMSATLEEHKRLAQWLRADYFTSSFRPLNLREFVVIDGAVFDMVERRKDRVLSDEFRISADVKNLIGMTIEAVLDEKAVLIFCPTKAETEKYATLLARYVRYCASKGAAGRFYRATEFLAPPEQRQIVEYFAQKTFCADADLLGVIATGIAFHHAGLTMEEREEIEFLFRNGSLKVLVSTSTLSSGVNLPAHRVLIMSSATSHIPLNSVTYRQMVGRAGRQGQRVIEGESYVLCSKADWPTIQSQIERRQTTCSARSIARIVLEAVSSEFVTSYAQLESLLSYLFSDMRDDVDAELGRLNELKLIACIPSDANGSLALGNGEAAVGAPSPAAMRLLPTQLGRAVLASSLPPGIATQIFADLENATRSLCLDSELHMLFLVTPINNLAINANAIDWNFYHQTWAELAEPLARVARRVGVTEKFFMQKLSGRMFGKDDETLNLHIRFFATLVLFELINENPLEKVSRRFRINRGLLQSLQQQAATYAYMVVSFCDRLGWHYLKALLEGFAERMQFGVRRDLTELVRVPGVDAIRARHFHQNGIKSLVMLANAMVPEICRILRKAVPFPTNPNADSNKNTWLFGEPPLEDVDAAQALVERAMDALREKMEFASFPMSLFKRGPAMDGTIASTISQWISDDNELTVSELLHQSAVNDLCDTLSPLQLGGTMKAKYLAVMDEEDEQHDELPPRISVNDDVGLMADGRDTNGNGRGTVDAHVDSESFNIDDLPLASRENVCPTASLKKLAQRRPRAATGSENVTPTRRRAAAKSPAVRRPSERPPKSAAVTEDEGNNQDDLEEGLLLKIQLKSLDCAQILVDGRPVKLTPSRRGLTAQKKTWSERVSKGLTPNTEDSPLHKRRSPFAALQPPDFSAADSGNDHDASNVQRTVEPIGDTVSADEMTVLTKGVNVSNSIDDSLNVFLVEDGVSAGDEMMIFGGNNTSHLNPQSSFISGPGGHDIFAGAAITTSTPMPPRNSSGGTNLGVAAAAVAARIGSAVGRSVSNSPTDLSVQSSADEPIADRSCVSSQCGGSAIDAAGLCINLLEICNNTVLNSSRDGSSLAADHSVQRRGSERNSLHDDDSLNAVVAMGCAQAASTASDRLSPECDEDSVKDAVANKIPDSITLRRCMALKKKKDEHPPSAGDDEELQFTDDSAGSPGIREPPNISPIRCRPAIVNEREQEALSLNPFAKHSDGTPTANRRPLSSSFALRRARLAETPNRASSSIVVVESVKSPAAGKNEDGIQLICRCNWPPRGLYGHQSESANENEDDGAAVAAHRLSCVLLDSEAFETNADINNDDRKGGRIGGASCGLSLAYGGNEVLIYVPITRRCYLLPLKRVAGSCSHCKVADLESLLCEFLMDASVTKWLPNALVFLRGVRRVFLRQSAPSDGDSWRTPDSNGGGMTYRSPASRDSAQKNSTAQCAFTQRPLNIGCVRTLDALDVDDAVETEDVGQPTFASSDDVESPDTRGVTTTSKVGAPRPKDVMRQIAKRLGVTKWQPRWNAASRARFSASLASRAMGAAIDAHLAHAVAFEMGRRADARRRRLQRLYLASLETIAGVELAGMAFYWQRATKMVAAIVAQMVDAERRIFRLCGGVKFNVDSPDEVANMLFVKLNLPAPANATNTRRHLSTNNAVLHQIDHPAASAIIQWRKLQHTHSALRGLLQEAAVQASVDSRLRTLFDNFSAASGRISSAQPNLQFLPKEPLIAYKYSARSVFVAPPGMILMAADYCQLELRVLCELSQDRALAALLMNSSDRKRLYSDRDHGSDIHDDHLDDEQFETDPFERIAEQFRVFQKDSSSSFKSLRRFPSSSSGVESSVEAMTVESFDCDRQKAKQLCYAIIYGMGSETLAREMHVSRADAQTLINRFFDMFPKVKCWMQRRSDQCRERAYCETFLGRRRSFAALAAVGERTGEENRQSRQAINFIVQGTASEIFRQALMNVDRMLLDEFPEGAESIAPPRIVMQLHDEIIVEVAEVQAVRCARILRRAMENVFSAHGFRLPFPVKLSRGKSWGSLMPF